MGDQEDQMTEPNINNSVITFDNFTILKEFSNIANLVSNEDFLKLMPGHKGVKWVPMFNCLKEDILSEMVQEISLMWEYENMPAKLEVLDKQKEKFSEVNGTVWRPQHNVKSQLRSFDVANLRKQMTILESLAQENESKVIRLRKTVSAKRAYLKALQMDIQKYQKKNEQIMSKIDGKIKSHGKLAEYVIPNMIDMNDIQWSTNLEILIKK